jgi:hypothetical protein
MNKMQYKSEIQGIVIMLSLTIIINKNKKIRNNDQI